MDGSCLPETLLETFESIEETLKRAKTSYSGLNTTFKFSLTWLIVRVLEDPNGFISKNYGILGQAISTYSKLFTKYLMIHESLFRKYHVMLVSELDAAPEKN